jgi:hypothetical protein
MRSVMNVRKLNREFHITLNTLDYGRVRLVQTKTGFFYVNVLMSKTVLTHKYRRNRLRLCANRTRPKLLGYISSNLQKDQ